MDDYRRDEKQPHPAMVENADVGQVHPAEEKRVLRKLDMLLMPLLWCMFFIAYLVMITVLNVARLCVLTLILA